MRILKQKDCILKNEVVLSLVVQSGKHMRRPADRWRRRCL